MGSEEHSVLMPVYAIKINIAVGMMSDSDVITTVVTTRSSLMGAERYQSTRQDLGDCSDSNDLRREICSRIPRDGSAEAATKHLHRQSHKV